MAIDEALRSIVKDTLRITWGEDDDLIDNIAQRGMAAINKIAGSELDYSKPTRQQSLLLDYCRYNYNKESEFFSSDFLTELMQINLLGGDE